MGGYIPPKGGGAREEGIFRIGAAAAQRARLLFDHWVKRGEERERPTTHRSEHGISDETQMAQMGASHDTMCSLLTISQCALNI
jgi:hypothetical protein